MTLVDQSIQLSVFPCFALTPPKVNVSFTTERSDGGICKQLPREGWASKAMIYTKIWIGRVEGGTLMPYDTLFHQISPPPLYC